MPTKAQIFLPLATDPAPIMTYSMYSNPKIVQQRRFDTRDKAMVMRSQEQMRKDASQFYSRRAFN